MESVKNSLSQLELSKIEKFNSKFSTYNPITFLNQDNIEFVNQYIANDDDGLILLSTISKIIVLFKHSTFLTVDNKPVTHYDAVVSISLQYFDTISNVIGEKTLSDSVIGEINTANLESRHDLFIHGLLTFNKGDNDENIIF